MGKALGQQHINSSGETLRQINKLEKHFEQFEGRFDSHLEVYRENGKEMAALKVEIKNLCVNIVKLDKTVIDALKENSNRISKLENWRWYVLGFILAIFVVSGFVLNLINNNIEYRVQTMVQEEIKKFDFNIE